MTTIFLVYMFVGFLKSSWDEFNEMFDKEIRGVLKNNENSVFNRIVCFILYLMCTAVCLLVWPVFIFYNLEDKVEGK